MSKPYTHSPNPFTIHSRTSSPSPSAPPRHQAAQYKQYTQTRQNQKINMKAIQIRATLPSPVTVKGFKANPRNRRKLEQRFIDDFDKTPRLRLNYSPKYKPLATTVFGDRESDSELEEYLSPMRAGEDDGYDDYGGNGDFGNYKGENYKGKNYKGNFEDFEIEGENVRVEKIDLTPQRVDYNDTKNNPSSPSHNPAVKFKNNKIQKIYEKNEKYNVKITSPTKHASPTPKIHKLHLTQKDYYSKLKPEGFEYSIQVKQHYVPKTSRTGNRTSRLTPGSLEASEGPARSTSRNKDRKMLSYPYPQILMLKNSPKIDKIYNDNDHTPHYMDDYEQIKPKISKKNIREKSQNWKKLDLFTLHDNEFIKKLEEPQNAVVLARYLKMKKNVYNQQRRGTVWDRMTKGGILRMSEKSQRALTQRNWRRLKENDVVEWEFGGREEEMRERVKKGKEFSEVRR